MQTNLNSNQILLNKVQDVIIQIDSNNLDEREKLALNFLEKFIVNIKAAIQLINSQFYDEAYLVLRLALEHMFNIYALLNDTSYFYEMMKTSKSSISKTLSIINVDIQNSPIKVLTPESEERLALEIAEINSNPITRSSSIENAAGKSKIAFLYNTDYRRFSSLHAHSSVASAIIKYNDESIPDLFTSIENYLLLIDELLQEKFLDK